MDLLLKAKIVLVIHLVQCQCTVASGIESVESLEHHQLEPKFKICCVHKSDIDMVSGIIITVPVTVA